MEQGDNLEGLSQRPRDPDWADFQASDWSSNPEFHVVQEQDLTLDSLRQAITMKVR